jgi:hypothetical protein
MPSRFPSRRQRIRQESFFHRPRLVYLEPRLLLGDTVLGPVLASSWLAGKLATIGTTDVISITDDQSIPSWRSQADGGGSLCLEWSGAVGSDAVAASATGVTQLAWTESSDTLDLGTGPALDGVRWSAERPLALPVVLEPPGTPAIPALNSGTPFSGRQGPGESAAFVPPGIAFPLTAIQPASNRAVTPGGKLAATPSTQQAQKSLAKLPLAFEANVGQADPSVQFLAHGAGYAVALSGTEAVMALNAPASGLRGQGSGPLERLPTAAAAATVVRLQVLGGNPAPRVTAQGPLPGKVNYFLGNDPSQWHTNVPTFARIAYQDVYPGISLAYYGQGQQLEYDFVVAPGADPRAIRLGFAGADRVAVDPAGNLVVQARGQELQEHRPRVYQDLAGVRQEVEGRFVLLPSASAATREVAFQLGSYDPSRPLVIDPVVNPVLTYSTYLGGNNFDVGLGIAVDPASGDVLLTGSTSSANFPLANAFQGRLLGNTNAFVTRLTADGSALVYSTYLGGSVLEQGNAIAVDPNTGDALVTGETRSRDFPTVNALDPRFGGPVQDAFVTRLSPDGSALVYSTYLGGTQDDVGYGIAVDPSTGDALVTGATASTNFPTANALQPRYGGGFSDAFVTRIRADGSAYVYSTYLGGNGNDIGFAVAVDPATGDVLVTGQTGSANFPTAQPWHPSLQGRLNVFVARLRADGGALVYSTYLGGSDEDIGHGIAVDPTTGEAVVTGQTTSTDFPTANAVQSQLPGGILAAFVTRLSADGSALVYSTYLGGSTSSAQAFGVAVDARTGDTLVTGYTGSTDFPLRDPLAGQGFAHGQSDVFVVRLRAQGALDFSTYLGGSGIDDGFGIAVDPNTGDALVVGSTSSTDFPTVSPLQEHNGGGTDAFVSRIFFPTLSPGMPVAAPASVAGTPTGIPV